MLFQESTNAHTGHVVIIIMQDAELSGTQWLEYMHRTTTIVHWRARKRQMCQRRSQHQRKEHANKRLDFDQHRAVSDHVRNEILAS